MFLFVCGQYQLSDCLRTSQLLWLYLQKWSFYWKGDQLLPTFSIITAPKFHLASLGILLGYITVYNIICISFLIKILVLSTLGASSHDVSWNIYTSINLLQKYEEMIKIITFFCFTILINEILFYKCKLRRNYLLIPI